MFRAPRVVWALLLLLPAAAAATAGETLSGTEVPAGRLTLPEAEGGDFQMTSFEAALNDRVYNAIAGGGGGQPKVWDFNLTQTVDYGTNLALPLSLTPANTLVAPLSNLTQIGILNNFNLLNPADPLVGIFEDDFQFQTTAGAKRTWQINDISSFSAGYGVYSNLHPKVNQLDLLNNSGTGNYSRRLSDRTVGALDYSYAYWLLDGSSFVTQSVVTPSFLMRYNDRWDFKGTASYGNSSFRQTNFLNSDNYATTSEMIRYVDDERVNYVNLGTGYGYSNAIDETYSYRVTNFFIGARKRFGPDQKNEFRVVASYWYYYFAGTDPVQVGVRRHDNVFSISPTLARNLNDNTQIFGTYMYYNDDSNITRQLYSQNLVSLGISFVR